ncbi:MAG: GNAT family N-acetyltransferase [Ignavibacteria bacterium]|nr:GNAT family N-acetyltransferase [Ignavibacteria bacterium]
MKKPEVFLKGNTVSLSILTEEDIQYSNWYRWYNDRETTYYMQQGYFPNTEEKQLIFFKNEIQHSANKIQLGILPAESEHIIGVVSLSNIDYINRKAEFSIIIGEKEHRGKGYGLEATRLIIDHGFSKLNLNKIYLGVISEHREAIKSYEKAGFKTDGLLRKDILMHGKYYDTLVMSILAEEFFKF